MKRAKPVRYEEFRQRVRRHRRTDVLEAVASLNALLQQAEFGEVAKPSLPNFVTPFGLAGIARAALAWERAQGHTCRGARPY